jgi:aminoglycoside phosphotransferase family enzyme/predicted kinase
MLGEASLVQQLLDPNCYDHPVEEVELIETHISWIFLAGDYAYKLKKPVDLGFLDFSSLDKRRFYCLEEVRLNSLFTPELYLDVVPVGGTTKKLHVGSTPARDYLVRMKRFDQSCQLDKMLQNNQLSATQISAFAAKVAAIHQQATSAPATSSFGSYEAIMQPVLTNFIQLRKILGEKKFKASFAPLESWSRKTARRLEPFFIARKQAGHIRECHGDMHLRNMAWVEGRPLLFDCIEFNPSLRIIDTVSDIAFLIMDLDDRLQGPLGWTFLDAYMQQSGDFSGLAGLRFYQVYRALVRAKVTAIQLSQQPAVQQTLIDLLSSYLELAKSYLDPPQARLILTRGLSGAGKTHLVNELAPRIGALCLHSDRERKRNRDADTSADRYSAAARGKIYTQLAELAQNMLNQGFSTIIDATFLHRQDRQLFSALATKTGVPLTILDFQLSEDVLRRRLRSRRDTPDAFSDADEKVLDLQLAEGEPLSMEEQQRSLVVSESTTAEELALRLKL